MVILSQLRIKIYLIKYLKYLNNKYSSLSKSCEVHIEKLTGGLMFGLFSKDAKSTFKCKSCGYKW